jgi:ATP-dependent helicase/DNAse subunit B
LSLTLVTGPANAEKARVVIDAYVAAAAREPLLVVPTLPDVDRYRRELAGRGLVFGAQVLTPQGLERELARRGGITRRPLGELARERIAVAAVRRTPLKVLGASSRTPGFLGALLALVDELEALRISPARWLAALRTWTDTEPGRAAYAEDLGALYRAYGAGVERAGRLDATQHTVAALDALRTEPARWGETPVLLYGFDDLTLLQRDLVETLAQRVGAEVTVSLPYEPGREAFAGTERTYQELLALGAERVELPAVAGHYASPALHHLERHLYEPDAGRALTEDGAVQLLCGGGERAEVELVGAHLVRLLRDGVPPGEIAVAVRRPAAVAPLIERVFSAYGIPFALERKVPAGHTALGRGVLALLRSALLDADTDELLAFLRTPGFLRRPDLADELEADVRRRGLRSAAEARDAWEEAGRFPLEVLDRARAAHARGPAELCTWLAEEAGRLFAAPLKGLAPVLDPAQETEARVAAALRRALRELARLAAGDPALVPGAEELVRLLGELPVRVGRRAAPDLVTVADPLAIRARRVRALFVCGLQEGAFPSAPAPEPFLGDADRRALNAAAGLRLELREDALGAERSLFYAAVSRPTDRLILSWHDADDEGAPAVRSLFVDDVLDLLPEGFEDRATLRRELGAAGWTDPALAPTAREAARAAASAAEAARDEHIAPLRDPAILAELRGREEWSASAIEQWVACPVKWFVERQLDATELLPDPEPMVRGALAHKVLEEALAGHAGEQEPRPLCPGDAPRLRALAHEALQRHAAGYPISANPERLRAALRRLEADLVRYLEWAAHAGSAHAPAHFELTFGGREERPAVELDGLTLRGRIDRIDVGGDGTAMLYDYKGSTAAPQAKWVPDGKLQLALYMLALPHLLGLEAVAGLYQPLGGSDDPKPRGLARDEADRGQKLTKNDRVDDAAFAAVLDGALAAAITAVSEIRAGRLEPRPATCGWRNGGCTHPSVCRSEGL